jgi:hypothetical protein
MTEARTKTNFSFIDDGEPINPIIPGSSITVSSSSNEVTIKLGIPKTDYLETLVSDDFGGGITVSPSDAKIFFIDVECDDMLFCTQDASYYLVCFKDENNVAILIYTDRNVTFNGTNSDSGDTYKWNVSLKTGWNYLILSLSIDGKTIIYTSSVNQPSDFNWTVMIEEKLPELIWF